MRFSSRFEVEAIEKFDKIGDRVLSKVTSVFFTIIIESKDRWKTGIKIFPKLI